MLLKFIKCEPKPGMEEAFSKAQESWSAISSCSGFNGQLGGWENNGENAFVLGLWEDRTSIDNFMENIHNNITDRNNQGETYNRCEVDLLNVDGNLEFGSYGCRVPIERVNYIRVVDCLLHYDGCNQFFLDQKNIWNPAMSSCSGMLGGFLANINPEQNRYLVISFWESDIALQEYMEKTYPEAREIVSPKDYIKSIIGYQVRVNRAWDVIPKKKINWTK